MKNSVLAAVAVVALVAPASAAGATTSGGTSAGTSAVDAPPLPSIAQVADVYPYVAGSKAVSIDYSDVAVLSAADCTAFATIGRGEAGEVNFYVKGSHLATPEGKDEPQVAATVFVTAKQARRVLTRYQTYIDTCAGRHSSGQDSTRVRRVELAAGPRTSASFRVVRRGADDYLSYEVHQLTRQGRVLVETEVSNTVRAPKAARAQKLNAIQVGVLT